jgi:hypothetical protein
VSRFARPLLLDIREQIHLAWLRLRVRCGQRDEEQRNRRDQSPASENER